MTAVALALWLVIHAMERMEDMAWQRPLGAALLHRLRHGANRPMERQVTDGGGWLGMQLPRASRHRRRAGVWAFVPRPPIIGIFLLTDHLCSSSLVRDGWDELQDLALPPRRALPAAHRTEHAHYPWSGELPGTNARVSSGRLGTRMRPAGAGAVAAAGHLAGDTPPGRGGNGTGAVVTLEQRRTRPCARGAGQDRSPRPSEDCETSFTPRIVGGAQNGGRPGWATCSATGAGR
ncbi:MAG: hypothetical protein R2838_16355 [Caldilineaceae bacterium]